MKKLIFVVLVLALNAGMVWSFQDFLLPSFLLAVPVIIVFVVFSGQIKRGLTSGGIKG